MKYIWLVIVAVLVLCLGCVGTLYVLGLQGGTSVRLEYQANVPIATATPMATQVVREETCEYSGNTTDAGIQLKNESRVRGPAIVQLDKNNIVVVNPGKYYTAPTGSVVWTYKGDLDCLNAQLEYFPYKSIDRVE